MSARTQQALDRFDNRRRRDPRLRNRSVLSAELVERCRSLRSARADQPAESAWEAAGYPDRDAWERLELDPFAR